jgi:hypothetical protein
MAEQRAGRQQEQRVAVWGCRIHHTPAGTACQGCIDQGELVTWADTGDEEDRRSMSYDDNQCPACGERHTIRWRGSTPTTDSWDCRECGGSWVIEVALSRTHTGLRERAEING